MYRALIVDDEKMIRTGIQNCIDWESIGIDKTYTAASAKEALSLIHENKPEIIITDISMSEMNGLELIEAIRLRNEECRIIVLTGYDRFDYARSALQLRAQDFLLKPVDENELQESIRRQIDELEASRLEKEKRALLNRTQGANRQLRLEMYLSDFILGKEVPSDKQESFFHEFSLEPCQMLRIGILLPVLSTADSSENQYFRTQNILTICMNILDEKKLGISFSENNGRIFLIFFEDILEHTANFAKELADLIENEYNDRVRIVLGSIQKGFHNLNISYNDAMYTLENEKESWEKVLRVKWEENREHIFRETYLEFEEALLANINNAERFLHILDRFEQALESYNVSAGYAGRCMIGLSSSIYYTYIAETGENVDDRLTVLLKAINGSDRNTITSLVKQFFTNLLVREQGDEHELVRKVKKIIHESLGSDLSVSSLAEQVYVTPNYLSRIFKQETTEGCNEYIVRKRIEKAKSLLETTTLKTGEIAGIIGYHDINYFSLAFKKHTGMSPTKYRDEITERRENAT